MAVKAVKPIVDVPFFFVNDNRVTFSYIFTAAQPGMFTVNPNGTINAKTAKQVYSFTHFDAWAYGTNFFTISLFKSDHNDPGCALHQRRHQRHLRCRPTAPAQPKSTACSARPSASTKSSIPRPSPSGRCATSRSKSAWMPTPRTASSAPPSATSLPVCSSPSICPTRATSTSRPLMYWEFSNHNSFAQCNSGFSGPTAGRDLPYRRQHLVQADLGGRNQLLHGSRLPAAEHAVSSRSAAAPAWYGKKGSDTEPLPALGPANGVFTTAVEFNSEPIRLTFDASKAFWGPKYSHLRRRLGRLSLLAEQVRPRPQCRAGCLHCRCRRRHPSATAPAPKSSLYSGITVKF